MAALLAAALAPSAEAMSLEEVLARLEDTSELRAALLMVDGAESQLQSLGFAGDPTLSLEPQLKATTREWEPFAEQVALSVAATARLPLGLSAVDKEEAAAAEVPRKLPAK